MTDKSKIAELENLLPEWASWKTCSPMYDKPEKTSGEASTGPRVPPRVWMTNPALLSKFRKITEAYEQLPDVQRLAIKRIYIDGISAPVKAAGVLGVTVHTLNRYKAAAVTKMALTVD